MEAPFAELSDYSLEFFKSVNEVSKNPLSIEYRVSVIKSGETLTETFRAISFRLVRIRSNAREDAKRIITQVEHIAREMVRVNAKIRRAASRGETPNDLLDKRDRLLDELFLLVDYQVEDFPSGFQVKLAVRPLILGSTYWHLKLGESAGRRTLLGGG